MSEMITELPNETRIQYLVRVLEWFAENTIAGECVAEYDETICDLACLAVDFRSEVEAVER